MCARALPAGKGGVLVFVQMWLLTFKKHVLMVSAPRGRSGDQRGAVGTG